MLSDEALMLQLCAASDPLDSNRIFNEVFERYRGKVISWCNRIAKDRDTASDLAQEVFLKAYRFRDSFRGDAKFSTWLYAIARNHCLTALKKRRAEPPQIEITVHLRLRDCRAVDPDAAAERGEAYRGMMRLMARTLDPLEVRIMALHYGYDVPLETITRDLELNNPSGAKAYIVNARRKLHGALRRRGWKRPMEPVFGIRQSWRDEAAA